MSSATFPGGPGQERLFDGQRPHLQKNGGSNEEKIPTIEVARLKTL